MYLYQEEYAGETEKRGIGGKYAFAQIQSGDIYMGKCIGH